MSPGTASSGSRYARKVASGTVPMSATAAAMVTAALYRNFWDDTRRWSHRHRALDHGGTRVQVEIVEHVVDR
jgi:hypothetical protein